MKIPDSSVAVKWITPENDSDLAELLLAEWTAQGELMVAPHLLPLEVTNTLRQKMRRERLSLQAAHAALDKFLALPITLHPTSSAASAQLHHDALELAARFDLPATYDAHYLALALALECELWTADQKLLGQLAGRVPNVRPLSDFTGS